MHKLPYPRLAWTCLLATIAGMHASAEFGLAQTASARGAAIRPVAVWPSGPLDVSAAFRSALDPAVARSLVGKSIPYFESERQANERGSARPLGSLRIVGARLTDGGRTLILATDPHPRMARYVLPLPTTDDVGAAKPPVAAETRYDLSGVEVAWSQEGDADDNRTWTGWWPLLDPEATRRLTRGSKPHEAGLELLSKPGHLVVGGFVRLPRGSVTLRIEANEPIEEASLGEAQADPAVPTTPAATHRAELTVPASGEPLFLTITLRTGANDQLFSLKASYRVGSAKTDHALEREQLILPWVALPAPSAAAPLVVPDLSGGDPVHGQAIYSGEQARCSQCHTFRGQGGKVGPDLTEVGKKGRAEIYRAIAAPSAVMEPEYLSYSVATRDGQVVVGLVRAEGADAIRVTDTNARATLIPRKEIDQVRPSANSIMPVGLTGALGDAAIRDVIAYLTAEPRPASTTR